MQIRIFLKLLVLGGVSVLLLVALIAIGGLTGERKNRLYDVRQNIADTYAGPQRILGPVFQITFRENWVTREVDRERGVQFNREMSAIQKKFVFPEALSYDGSLTVQERYRGIFKAHVFQTHGKIAGTVQFPELEALRTQQGSTLDLVSIKPILLLSDPRGISHVPVFRWNGEPIEVRSGTSLQGQGSGIHAVVPVDDTLGSTASFDVELPLHGSSRLEFVPIADNNTVRLSSAWPHPSFVGNFLATERTISPDGFEAEWNVNALATTAQQDLQVYNHHNSQYFGVDLIDPINPYPLTGRALKYGFLFIFITFAAFFLFELTKQLRIHPIQYGFVGLAQAVFFLLLLSLSEHMGFGRSYLAASAATICLIAFYLCGVLHGIGRGVLFGAVLSVLYGALYGLLQSEDHALVAGASLLFALLALVMILTRDLDWYALVQKKDADSG
jgi:inner membrane protein